MPRFYALDDRDPRIYYSQGWFPDNGTQDNQGAFGAPYLHTLTGTNTNSSFVFSFTGTTIEVIGTSAVRQIPITNGTGNGTTWDPKWECLVDGSSIGSNNPSSDVANNWPLCQNYDLSNGPHTLSVSVITMGQTFWVDLLRYRPSEDLQNGTKVEFVATIDPGINWGSGWDIYAADIGRYTIQGGTLLQFDFTGTSLSWFGFIPQEFPHKPADAVYIIDGGSQVPFVLKGLPDDATTTLRNQLFFNISNLPPGKHSLVVTHLGNSSTTPLTLSFMYFTDTVHPTPTSGPSPAPSTTVRPNKSGLSSAQIGGIVGGILSCALVLAVFLLYRWRQARRIREARARTESPRVSPFMVNVSLAGQSTHPMSSSMDPGFVATAGVGYGWESPRLHEAVLQPRRKKQESAGRAGAGGEQIAEGSGLPEPVMRHHQDSGIRLHTDTRRIDIPPNYTPD